MFSISREFTFCYGHRLTDHPGKCRHPHGHNGRVRITISESSLNSDGMVRDFTELKETVGRWIDAHLDHRMILSKGDPLVSVLTGLGEPIYLVDGNPTAETLAKLLYDVAQGEGFPVLEVEFWETAKCCAAYKKG